MNIYKHTITSLLYKDAETETVFIIAVARAGGASCVKFVFTDESGRVEPAVRKALRSLKRRGSIQMLAGREDFENRTTEAEFLLNKFPGIEEADENENDLPVFLYAKL